MISTIKWGDWQIALAKLGQASLVLRDGEGQALGLPPDYEAARKHLLAYLEEVGACPVQITGEPR